MQLPPTLKELDGQDTHVFEFTFIYVPFPLQVQLLPMLVELAGHNTHVFDTVLQ